MKPPLLCALLALSSCGHHHSTAPEPDPLRQSADDAAIQRRLTGSAAYMDDGPVRVVWAFYDTTYRLEAHAPTEGLVQWEVGAWWVGRDELEQLVVILDRTTGSIKQQDGSWKASNNYRYPMPLLLMGRSLTDPGLQMRFGAGRASYIYHLAPIDSLEAVRRGVDH